MIGALILFKLTSRIKKNLHEYGGREPAIAFFVQKDEIELNYNRR